MTNKIVGHLSEIGEGGFKIDSQSKVPVGLDYLLRIDLPREVANKSMMIFNARSKWCKPDKFDPSSFSAGFEIIDMGAGDQEIFQRMFDQYSGPTSEKKEDGGYLWK
jgi:hypothetical protein